MKLYERQAKGIEATNHDITSRRTETDHADVHKIQINKQRSPNPRTNKMSQYSKRKPATAKIPTKSQRCFRCGYSWPHNNGKCPAEGQKCNNCSKYNHFASVCNSKDKIREQLNQDSTHAIWNDIRSPHSNTTVTAAVTKAPTATRMPLLLMKSKTSPTQERNNARSMQT